VNDFFASSPVLLTTLVKSAVLLVALLTAVAYLSLFERKVVGHIQARVGPTRVGPHGLLQPLADGLKFLFKEDAMPAGADRLVFVLAPFLSLTVSLGAMALIPFGPAEIEIFGVRTTLAIAELDLGMLFVFAITALGVYGVALGGWASNSKYPLMGGLRSSAQMVSYELTLTISVIGVLLLAGTFNLREIVEAQSGSWFGVPRWFVIPQLIGFACFFLAAIAETNRTPFDLPEAESELVSGFHTEYSSFKFAMFFMAEYTAMMLVSCLATIFFFGGWHSPFPATPAFAWTVYIPAIVFGLGGIGLVLDGLRNHRGWFRVVLVILGLLLGGLAWLVALPAVNAVILGPFWFVTKAGFFLFVYVWVRGTLPRVRYDQLMGFGWKVLLPVALANVLVTAAVVLWRGLR
jgi:NADH-quinone oxidoreductase subunit H